MTKNQREETIWDIKSVLKCSKDVNLVLRDIKDFINHIADYERSQAEWVNAVIMEDNGLDYARTYLKGCCAETIEALLQDLEAVAYNHQPGRWDVQANCMKTS